MSIYINGWNQKHRIDFKFDSTYLNRSMRSLTAPILKYQEKHKPGIGFRKKMVFGSSSLESRSGRNTKTPVTEIREARNQQERGRKKWVELGSWQ
ncbi:hypothetical protein LXL04_020094 [Taraxacum kok-saghyz]